MLLRCGAAVALIGSVLVATGCKRSPSATSHATAAASSTPAPLARLAASVMSSARAARKADIELSPPPLTPPADAESGPQGLRYKVVKRGVGAPVAANDGIHAEFSTWTQTGTLVFSTYQSKGPVGVTAAIVPAALFGVVGTLPPGSKAWFWLPAPLVHSLRQEHAYFPYPDAALVIEYEPTEIDRRAPMPPPSADGAQPAAAGLDPGPPDAAGPPKAALVSTSGLRYVVLAPGRGDAKPKSDDRLTLLLTLWPVTGLVVDNPIFSRKTSATTLARAPAGLAPVLQTMTAGSGVRVWLPAGKAQLVAPVPAGHEAILDVGLVRIE
jgi:hypothetical protein